VYALVFLEHCTRRLHVAGGDRTSDGILDGAAGKKPRRRVGRTGQLAALPDPRPGREYTEPFDAVFAADGIEAMRTAPRAPRMNAHCERIIGTLRREALDHLLIWNETHARHVLGAYARHYNRHRPHQARGELPPLTQEHPAPVTDLTAHQLLRTRVLGGVITQYRYPA
jgi:hypothetical protein